MCKCCSSGKNASKYKKFAFLNGHHEDHDHDHEQDHGHHDGGHDQATHSHVPAKETSEKK